MTTRRIGMGGLWLALFVLFVLFVTGAYLARPVVKSPATVDIAADDVAAEAATASVKKQESLAREAATNAGNRAATIPMRIASLTLGGDEVLSALIALDRLVCVTSLVDDPDISNVQGFYPAHLPRIRELEVERIIGLAPDLVCAATYNSADALQVLERAALKVHRGQNINSLDGIEAAILDLGNHVRAEERARELVERFAGVRREVRVRLAEIKQRPRVLYWASGFTAGKRTTIDDVIREAGGINAAAEKGVAGDVDPERVIGIDPEFVLCPQWPGYETDGGIEKHPLLRNLRAVQDGKVVRIPARLLTSVSHFACEGLAQLARRLHPECFDEAAAAATLSAESAP